MGRTRVEALALISILEFYDSKRDAWIINFFNNYFWWAEDNFSYKLSSFALSGKKMGRKREGISKTPLVFEKSFKKN